MTSHDYAQIIHGIQNGSISPDIVKAYPANADIIKAAYAADSASIQYAELSVLNELGLQNQLELNDVLRIFSRELPSEEEKERLKEEFELNLTAKNWQKVAEICNKFWFEKPVEISIENTIKTLRDNKAFNDIRDLEQAYHQLQQPMDDELIQGPLPKTPETMEFEAFFRKILADSLDNLDFEKQIIDGDCFFIFVDGTRFNWTKMRPNIDFENINLNEEDLINFHRYLLETGEIELSTLKKGQSIEEISTVEKEYQKLVYTDPKTGKSLSEPDPPLSMAEMHAINIYTGTLYSTINGVMRNQTNLFDIKSAPDTYARAGIVYSGVIANALRKMPLISVKQCYRGLEFSNESSDLKTLIQAASHKSVVNLEGFISTSVAKTGAFDDKSVFFTFEDEHGVRGFPVYQLSKPETFQEKEVLIPPSQIQVTHYKYDEASGQHRFKARLVSDPTLKHSSEELKALEFVTNPELILFWLQDSKISPHDAILRFPDDINIILASSRKDPTILSQYSPAMLVELLAQENEPVNHNAIKKQLIANCLSEKILVIPDENRRVKEASKHSIDNFKPVLLKKIINNQSGTGLEIGTIRNDSFIEKLRAYRGEDVFLSTVRDKINQEQEQKNQMTHRYRAKMTVIQEKDMLTASNQHLKGLSV